MFEAFLKPPVAPLLIDAIAQLRGDEEDVKESSEALVVEESTTASGEEYQSQKAKPKSRGKTK